MHILLEILLGIVESLFPWTSKHDDRSVVGESELDRSAQRFKIYVIFVILVVAMAVGAWIYLRG